MSHPLLRSLALSAVFAIGAAPHSETLAQAPENQVALQKIDTQFDGRVVELTAANYDAVMNAGKPVLIDFYADWCGPCKLVVPEVIKVASRTNDVIVAKVNYDTMQNAEHKGHPLRKLQKEHGWALPTVGIFRRGGDGDLSEVIDVFSGIPNSHDMLDRIKQLPSAIAQIEAGKQARLDRTPR